MGNGLSPGLGGLTLAFPLLQAVQAFEVTELGPLLRLWIEPESPESFEPLGPAPELVEGTPERLAFLEWVEPAPESVALGGSYVSPSSDDVAAPCNCVFSWRVAIGEDFPKREGFRPTDCQMADDRRLFDGTWVSTVRLLDGHH